ncbi:MAG: hypothetical protein ACYDAN_13525 [Candidatus Limnocylindrales bacterium]
MSRPRRSLVAGAVLALLLAGCAAPPSQPPSSGPAEATRTPGPTSEPAPLETPPSSPATTSPTGARVRVLLEGRPGCDSQFVCTARLSVLPDGTDLAAKPGWGPASTDPTWQTVGDMVLGAPPDGDLPVVAAGAHLIVWSVSAQITATDGPATPGALASRCTSRVVVAPSATLLTVHVAFGSASTLAPGSARCTIRAVASAAAIPPTAAPVSGTASVPAALLPAAWRKVATPDLRAFGAVRWRIALGVAPDGAFIAILSSEEQEPAIVLRSPDGERWAVVGPLPDSRGAWVMSVAGNQHAIVAAGGAPDPKGPGIWSSPDGITWTRLSGSGSDGLLDASPVAANSAGFVAVGDGIGVTPWVSSHPATAWHHVGSRVASQDAGVIGIAPSGPGFVAVGWSNPHPVPEASAQTSDAGAWLSEDGRTWSPSAVTGGAGVALWSVAAQGSRLVALGDQQSSPQGALVFVSSDGGRTWAPATGPAPDSGCCTVTAVADGFLATTYTVWASRDGSSWDDSAWTAAAGAASGDTRMVRVAASGGHVVASLTTASAAPSFWIGSGP